MKFKELFDKDVLAETSHIRTDLKIYYELNLSLKKSKKNQDVVQQQTQSVQQEPVNNVSTPTPEGQPIQQIQEPVNNIPAPEGNTISPSDIVSSVVTEDDEKISSNTEEKIERKFSGEIKLTSNQKDNIQSINDIIEILSDTKKDGTPILDDFSSEIITLCASQNYQQIKSMIDKESKIFVEIYYGYTKFDLIGLRFNKHANADILTSTMLLDNNIINAKFSIDKINEKIAEFRNYETGRLNK